MNQDIQEILSLRQQIKELNSRSSSNRAKLESSFDCLDLTSVAECLKQAKSLLEQKEKILRLIDNVRQSFDFYSTCQSMLETADESIVEPLKSSVRGAEKALMLKLDEYVKLFPIKDVEQASYSITNLKLPDSSSQEKVTFKDGEILTRIESMIKILPNDELFLASEVATQESKLALDTFAACLDRISKAISADISTFRHSTETKIPDVEMLAKHVRKALVHERYIKETQQSQGKLTANLDVLLSKRVPELKTIFNQVLTWLDELVCIYRINVGLAKKIRDAQSNLNEKEGSNEKKSEIKAQFKASLSKLDPELSEDSFDDGLSDVTEDVTMAIDDLDCSHHQRK